MGTKNDPGRFDCYANAEPDEPMFVLLGRDRHAPTLVWLWAALRELDGEDPEKVAEARRCVVSMIRFAHDKGKRCVGLGSSVLAGTLDLIRMANAGIEAAGGALNAQTDEELLRRLLVKTAFDAEPAEGKPA